MTADCSGLALLKSLFLALSLLAQLSRCQMLTNCSDNQFWDGTRCANCSTCSGEREFVEEDCTPSADTRCNRCPVNFKFSSNFRVCLLQCETCPLQKCSTEFRSESQCECRLPMNCYSPGDVFCESPKDECVPTQPPPPPSPQPPPTQAGDDSLPPWGIGVIAVGAVVGIIAFSSLFLLIGLVGTKKHSTPDVPRSDESGHSELGLVSAHSGGTQSSYLSSPLLSKHSLDILRHSSPRIGAGLRGSLAGSPQFSTQGSLSASPVTGGKVGTGVGSIGSCSKSPSSIGSISSSLKSPGGVSPKGATTTTV